MCEKFGIVLALAALHNALGYCYGEIHHPERASEFNLKGEEIARGLMKQDYIGCRQFAKQVAQSSVNFMENLFDQGKVDAAWDRMKSLEEEAKSDDAGIDKSLVAGAVDDMSDMDDYDANEAAYEDMGDYE